MTAREMMKLFMMDFLSRVLMMELLILDHQFPYESPPARVREQLASGPTSTLRCRLLAIDRVWCLIVTTESEWRWWWWKTRDKEIYDGVDRVGDVDGPIVVGIHCISAIPQWTVPDDPIEAGNDIGDIDLTVCIAIAALESWITKKLFWQQSGAFEVEPVEVRDCAADHLTVVERGDFVEGATDDLVLDGRDVLPDTCGDGDCTHTVKNAGDTSTPWLAVRIIEKDLRSRRQRRSRIYIDGK
jgi:hypothetical protein